MKDKKKLKAGKKAAAKARRSRVYSISLPPEMAARAEALAKAEDRTMSELFREALRRYEADDALKALREAAAFGATQNPPGYAKEEIPELVKQIRAEMRAEEERKDRKAG